ncbi:MAG: phosphatase PAP2 family protein [Acidimicrobiales bacterium]
MTNGMGPVHRHAFDLAAHVDRVVEGWFGPLRGNAGLDIVAEAVTGLGDHGLVWALIAAWRGRRPGPERIEAFRALAVAGVTSSTVNAALKAAIGRSRPEPSGLGVASGGIPVRAPKTSSFPSGHTLAAFCAAAVMSRHGRGRSNAALFAVAVWVGLSRIHLGAHHPSDVLGGAVIGTALGYFGRRLI